MDGQRKRSPVEQAASAAKRLRDSKATSESTSVKKSLNTTEPLAGFLDAHAKDSNLDPKDSNSDPKDSNSDPKDSNLDPNDSNSGDHNLDPKDPISVDHNLDPKDPIPIDSDPISIDLDPISIDLDHNSNVTTTSNSNSSITKSDPNDSKSKGSNSEDHNNPNTKDPTVNDSNLNDQNATTTVSNSIDHNSTITKNDSNRLTEKQRKQAERELEKQRKQADRLAKKAAKEAEKQKLRELREAEKKEKEAQKEAERREKEAEKREKEAQKEAEKREKEAQKEAEKREKEAQKEAERREKEAEKREKLRAQPSISKFFKLSQPPTEPEVVCNRNLSDYEQHILPYQPRRDGIMFSVVCNTSYSPNELAMDPKLWLKSHSQRSAPREALLTCAEFQTQLAKAHDSTQIADLLAKLRIRRIQFSHLNPKQTADSVVQIPLNIEHRPPYIGTTLDLPTETTKQLQRNPFLTSLLTVTNYEYDSEMEWDENEDGEDLGEDDLDDSDDELEDADEMQTFLLPDDDAHPKRHKLVGPLVPVVLWGNDAELLPFELQVFGTSVGEPPATNESNEPANEPVNPTANSTATPTNKLATLCAKIPRAELYAALQTHHRSASTKTLVVELLKQQFPQALATEIKLIFDICFEQIGKKRREKRWVLKETARQFFKSE